MCYKYTLIYLMLKLYRVFTLLYIGGVLLNIRVNIPNLVNDTDLTHSLKTDQIKKYITHHELPETILIVIFLLFSPHSAVFHFLK